MRAAKCFSVIAIFVCAALLLGAAKPYLSAYPAPQAPRYDVSERALKENRNGVEISGVVPVFAVHESGAFAVALNERIAAETARLAANSTARGTKLNFSYKIYESGDVVSAVIFTEEKNTAANAKAAASLNFNAATREIITLTGVLGVNGVKIANRALKEEFAAHIDIYNATATEIDEYQTFYVNEDVVTLVFDKYSVAPGYRGIVYFSVDSAKITEFTVNSEHILNAASFNAKMVWLRPIAEAFGCAVGWESSAGTTIIVVDSKNPAVTIRLTIGKTAYTKGRTQFALEAAPEIRNNQTYVPITFFDEALGICYGFTDGAVVFSKYLK